MTNDLTTPRPPRPFFVDMNAIRLARVKAANMNERLADSLRDRGFSVRAAELSALARATKEAI